jgi:hypothetical protein
MLRIDSGDAKEASPANGKIGKCTFAIGICTDFLKKQHKELYKWVTFMIHR